MGEEKGPCGWPGRIVLLLRKKKKKNECKTCSDFGAQLNPGHLNIEHKLDFGLPLLKNSLGSFGSYHTEQQVDLAMKNIGCQTGFYAHNS